MLNAASIPFWPQINSHSKLKSLSRDNDSTDSVTALFEPLLCPAMGSPDHYGRQLNGLGGGLSSLSKVMVVAPSTASDCDVDYLFVQVGVKDGRIDVAGNCGNMSAAVAPFAIEERIVDARRLEIVGTVDVKSVADTTSTGSRHVRQARLRNLNTDRRILSQCWTLEDTHDVERVRFEERGNYTVDGVSGHASPIVMSFTSPGGSKTGQVLPTGRPRDELVLHDGRRVSASLTDISNPGVFVDGRTVGLETAISPETLNANHELMSHLESIRRAGAVKMGLDPNVSSVPKVVVIFPALDHTTAPDIVCQALSMEQPHKAVPMTLALNLGVACKMPGTIPHDLARHQDDHKTVIAHPSGQIEVGALFARNGEVQSAQIIRSARCLMRGEVNIALSQKLDVVTAAGS